MPAPSGLCGKRIVRHAHAVVLLVSVLPRIGVGQRTDTTVIRVGAPRYPGVAAVVEELTLGNGRQGAEYRLTNVNLSIGRDGSLYVIDMLDPMLSESTVRKYDRDGSFVRMVGRNGQGPGEYIFTAGDVKELPDGRLLVSDARGLVVYNSNGEGTGRWSAKASSANVGSRGILIDPRGFVYVFGSKSPYGSPYTPRGGVPIPILYRFNFDGRLIDTVEPPQAQFPRPAVRPLRFQLPFSPRHLTAWSPLGYFVTSHTSSYAIDLRIPPAISRSSAGEASWRDGDPVRSIRRSVTAVRVQGDERADWIHSITMFMRSAASTRNWEWTGPDIPTTKPPVRDIYVASDGRIWVRLSQPARLIPSVTIPTRPATLSESYRIDAMYRWVEPWVYDIYEPQGDYVGQVRLPNSTATFAARRDTLWIATTGSDEVPTVKRYRIAWRRE
jgi:hypothetical protein